MHLKTSLLLIAATALLAGCGHYGTYVQADDSALGRVVIYRNGIAFYERRAQVKEDSLTLSVPADKIDDFLKSLTVRDAKTGKTVPISYPTTGATRGATVDMTIKLPKGRTHDLIITYITEAPAWKPSYRVVVGEEGTVGLQGWAIVDNTSGEDWESVRIGVGSSSALSFRYDLRSVVHVFREELGGELRFAAAPPTGTTALGGAAGTVATLAALADDFLPRPVGHPSTVTSDESESWFESRGDMAAAETAAAQSPRYASRPAKDEMTKLVTKLRKKGGKVVIEGYANAGEKDAESQSLDRAHRVRNELVRQGIAPARLQVVARGAVSGNSAGVQLKLDGNDDTGGGEEIHIAAAEPVGESHFESPSPMTIERGTSAMVSIVDGDTPGDVVYLYTPDSKRGNARYAFKAVRFQNPTDSALEAGPVTVYGEGRFVGEGLTDPVPAGATTLVPFALDRQIVVDRGGDSKDRISSLIKVRRGVFTAEMRHKRITKLEITNRLPEASTVYVRHFVREGWTLVDGPKLHEKIGEDHLFVVTLDGGETRKVTIEEETPLTRTIDLRSPVGIELVRTYLSAASSDPRFQEAMTQLLSLHDDMLRNQEMIVSLQERVGEYRHRLNELHIQIASLRLVRESGSLMRHLKRKMTDMSNRVQKGTIDIVNHQEKLMMARIRFQDGVSELSLADKAKPVETASSDG